MIAIVAILSAFYLKSALALDLRPREEKPIRVIDIFTNYPSTDEVLKDYGRIRQERVQKENSALNATARDYRDYDYYDGYRPFDGYYHTNYHNSDRRNYATNDEDALESEFGVFENKKSYNYADNYKDKYVYVQGQKYTDYVPGYTYKQYTINKPQSEDDTATNFKDKLDLFINQVNTRPGFYTKRNKTQYTVHAFNPSDYTVNYADKFSFEVDDNLENYYTNPAVEPNPGSNEVDESLESEYGEIVTKPTKPPKKKRRRTTKKPTPAPLPLPYQVPGSEEEDEVIQTDPNNPVNTTRLRITNILRKYLVKMHNRKNGKRIDDYKDRTVATLNTISHAAYNPISYPIYLSNFTIDDAKEKFLYDPLASLKNKTKNFANKFLSLFTVIQFANFKCQATNAITAYEGTCFLPTQCAALGGLAMGYCAEGHGVCCVFKGTCGDSGANNCTYFESPGYPNYYPMDGGVVTPAPETTTTTRNPLTPDPRLSFLIRQARQSANDMTNALSCIYKVYKMNTNIKQMRIDFIDLELIGPTGGNCVEERLVITGTGLTTMVPILCGYNTGQHIYVDVSMLSGPLQLAVLANAVNRKRFKMRICQYDDGCSGNMNCLQYYTGVMGTVTSFNYEQAASFNRSTPEYLNNLNYAICIRREPGYCSITYTNAGANNVVYPFMIRNVDERGMLTVPAGQAGVGVINCPDDYIVINGIRLCGDRLNDGSVSSDFSRNAPVTDTSGGPIIIPVRTNAANTARGFKLMYTQNRCTMMMGTMP